MPDPPHCLHWPLTRLYSQMLAPPFCLHDSLAVLLADARPAAWLVGRFWSADFKLSPDIVDCSFARTYVGHDSGAATYVSACCLCVHMLLHTGAIVRTCVGHDSFCPAAASYHHTSIEAYTNSHCRRAGMSVRQSLNRALIVSVYILNRSLYSHCTRAGMSVRQSLDRALRES